MKSILLLFTLCITLTISTQTVVNVLRSYNLDKIEHSHKQKVAQILLMKDDKNPLSAQLQLVFENIIETSVFDSQDDYAVLYFVGESINMKYTVKYADVLQTNYKEIINVISTANGEVIGFNYFQEKLKKKQLKSSVVNIIKPEQGKQHVFTYTMQPIKPKGEAEQEETFFSKYKWYLIGFGIVVYAMSNIDPEKAQQQMAQAQKK